MNSPCRVWQKNWAKKVLALKQSFQTLMLSLKAVKLKICTMKGSVVLLSLHFPHSFCERTWIKQEKIAADTDAYWPFADYADTGRSLQVGPCARMHGSRFTKLWSLRQCWWWLLPIGIRLGGGIKREVLCRFSR